MSKEEDYSRQLVELIDEKLKKLIQYENKINKIKEILVDFQYSNITQTELVHEILNVIGCPPVIVNVKSKHQSFF